MTKDDSDRLARVETKLDVLIDKERTNEKRLSGLEKTVWTFSGIFTAVSAVFTSKIFS